MPPWWHKPVTLATRACHPDDTSLPPRWHDNALGITKTSAPRKQGVYPEPKCFLTTAATRQWIRHGSSSYYVRGHAPTASLPTLALPLAIQHPNAKSGRHYSKSQNSEEKQEDHHVFMHLQSRFSNQKTKVSLYHTRPLRYSLKAKRGMFSIHD